MLVAFIIPFCALLSAFVLFVVLLEEYFVKENDKIVPLEIQRLLLTWGHQRVALDLRLYEPFIVAWKHANNFFPTISSDRAIDF